MDLNCIARLQTKKLFSDLSLYQPTTNSEVISGFKTPLAHPATYSELFSALRFGQSATWSEAICGFRILPTGGNFILYLRFITGIHDRRLLSDLRLYHPTTSSEVTCVFKLVSPDYALESDFGFKIAPPAGKLGAPVRISGCRSLLPRGRPG